MRRMVRTARASCRRQSRHVWLSRRGPLSGGGNMSGPTGVCWASIASVHQARWRICFHTSASQPIMSVDRYASCSSELARESKTVLFERIEGMAIKVGINGYGRIGRNILRALYEAKRNSQVQIVAINDLGDAKTNAHLTRYDTVHGKFPGEVAVDGDSMVVNGDRIRVLAERDPAKLPWGDLGVEFVLECTGLFTSKAKASAHLKDRKS